MMKIQEESSVKINDQWYWTVKSFSALTQRTERVIRSLITHGNRHRKLKAISFNGRLYIEEQEIFEYDFVTGGRPASMGDFVERFYLEGDELLREEACVKRCQE